MFKDFQTSFIPILKGFLGQSLSNYLPSIKSDFTLNIYCSCEDEIITNQV